MDDRIHGRTVDQRMQGPLPATGPESEKSVPYYDIPAAAPFGGNAHERDGDDSCPRQLAAIGSPPGFFADVETNRRLFTVIALSFGTVLLFADQNLMSPNLTAIANEFGFDDLERDRKLGGDIALAFFVLGAPAALVIGCMADTVQNRVRLYAITIFLGEGSCLLTYWIRTYAQLYACRAITGISVGGALPLIFSILGDMFPSDQRHKVSSLVGIGVGVGISVGQGVAGFIGPRYGWRLPFVVVSAPALVCALVVWLFVKEPERGAAEEAMMRHRGLGQEARYSSLRRKSSSDESSSDPSTDDSKRELSLASVRINPRRTLSLTKTKSSPFGMELHLETFRTLIRTPTVILSLLQGAPGCVPWGIVNVFLADFLSENRGMTVELATVVLLVFGFGNFLGLLFGGFLGSHLYARDKRLPSLLAGLSALFGTVPFWFLLNAVHDSTSIFVTYPVALVSGFSTGITGPIVKATLQNVTQPDGRGQAFALYNTFDDFGRGLGPVFVAMLISHLGGRTPAFNAGTAGWLVCGILNLSIFFFVKNDEEKTQRDLEARLGGAAAQEEDGVAMQPIRASLNQIDPC